MEMNSALNDKRNKRGALFSDDETSLHVKGLIGNGAPQSHDNDQYQFNEEGMAHFESENENDGHNEE